MPPKPMSAPGSLPPSASSSSGVSGLPLPYSQVPGVPSARKETRGPNRTSKTANKLKVLPTETKTVKSDEAGYQGKARGLNENAIREDDEEDDDDDDEDDDEETLHGDGVQFYDALSQIPAGSARRDALRLTKTEKAKLPRVTAYCTAAGFNLPALQSYFSSRSSGYRCNPRLFDTECLHTPYLPPAPSSSNSPTAKAKSDPAVVPEADLLNLGDSLVGEGSHHAEGIDESERLLDTKATHQERDRRASHSSSTPHDHAFSSSERLKREAQELNDREVHERRRQHLANRVTGFATRPSALSAGPPPAGGKNTVKRTRRKGSRASVHDEFEGSDREDGDDDEEWVPDVFIFEYGTVVIWGMTEREEKRVLSNLRKFEIEKLAAEDIEMEDLNFYYANYSRIYNDVITLRKGSSFMTKLSLSHALSQSVKISLFEELIASTIDQTKDLPKSLSETGKIGMPRKEIMKQIGSLFILRINWGGSILETPEFFWSYPDLEPLYQAARSYLEIAQRIDLLNARVEVLQDMLTLLKESVNSSHGESLETIVIWLIGVEIILGIMTILVDVVSGA